MGTPHDPGQHPEDEPRRGSLPDEQARAPLPDAASVRRMGLRLFLLSLSVFFAASLLVFVLTHLSRPPDYPPVSKPPPLAMWTSTLVLLCAGMAAEGAAYYARRGRLDEVQRWIRVTFFMSSAFVAVQSHAVVRLVHEHEIALSKLSLGMEGLTFCLIAIHAAHVLGGLVAVGNLTWRSLDGRLGLEQLPTVRGCAAYWHFLEAVWLAMFATFLLTS